MRLIDLRIEWLAQYAGDVAELAPDSPELVRLARRDRLEGYLGATRAAVLALPFEPTAADPWGRLAAGLARLEAEFCGRLLLGPEDVARYHQEPEGLTWGTLSVSGLDPDDLETRSRLPLLFERGVRIFGFATGPGREVMEALEAIGTGAPGQPRAGLDLAGLSPAAVEAVLGWLEAEEVRVERVVPLLSRHGVGDPPGSAAGAWPEESLARLRALGGTIGLDPGPPWHADADALIRSIGRLSAHPFRGVAGPEGLALCAGLLDQDTAITGLETAGGIVTWAEGALDRPTAAAVVHGSAGGLLESLAGGL